MFWNRTSLRGIVNLLGSHTVCQSYGMDTPPIATTYKNHRFPVEIISHAVWLYFRFCLSFRDVEEILLERGVVVTYAAIRQWCRKFGQAICHSAPSPPSAAWRQVAQGEQMPQLAGNHGHGTGRLKGRER